MTNIVAALGRFSRAATGFVTALLAVSIILLFVTGADVKIPDKVFTAITPMFVLLLGWWLKQGQRETQRKVDEVPARVNGYAVDFAEARSFTRGGQAAVRMLLENLPVAYVEVSAASLAVVRCNAAALRLTCYEPGELVGQSIQTLVPEESREAHVMFMREFVGNPAMRPMGVARCATVRRKDGSRIPVEIMLGMFSGQSEMVVIAIIWQLRPE